MSLLLFLVPQTDRGSAKKAQIPGFPQVVQAIGSCFLFTKRYDEGKVK